MFETQYQTWGLSSLGFLPARWRTEDPSVPIVLPHLNIASSNLYMHPALLAPSTYRVQRGSGAAVGGCAPTKAARSSLGLVGGEWE